MGDSVVLVCAVLGSLASGVMVAYGVCIGLFGLCRMHARQVTVEEQVVRMGGSASVVEG